MKRYQITMNGRTFDVHLLSDPLQDQVQVEVNGEAFTVQVRALPSEAKMTETVRSPATSGSEPTTKVKTRTPSGSSVVAPLPGVIKSIAVQPGQQVSAGDKLLVIEAMKMDNVIRATREGIVETVYTAEGRQVAHGELMLEYRR